MECFAKLLNHLFQLVGITGAQRLRYNGFNSVGQASVRGGHTYTSYRTFSISPSGVVRKKKVVLFQKPELKWRQLQWFGFAPCQLL